MVKIGNIELRNQPLILAPMEDITDPSFRYMCKQFGADLMYTEFISSDGLIRNGRKSIQKLDIYDYERPIGIQLYGHLIDSMVEAAQIAEKSNPDLIDINFGCPVRKIANRGAGAGMTRDIPQMVRMTEAIVKATKLPVTVKTRLGWDEESKNIVEVAERLQDVGIKALTIHARTRSQLYKGRADWTLIGEVKNNQKIKMLTWQKPISKNQLKTKESQEVFMKCGGIFPPIFVGFLILKKPASGYLQPWM